MSLQTPEGRAEEIRTIREEYLGGDLCTEYDPGCFQCQVQVLIAEIDSLKVAVAPVAKAVEAAVREAVSEAVSAERKAYAARLEDLADRTLGFLDALEDHIEALRAEEQVHAERPREERG